MDYDDHVDDWWQKAAIFARCVNDEITRDEALKIYETKFYDKLVWTPLELSYLQFKQERLVMTQEKWQEVTQKVLKRDLMPWFYNAPHIEAEIIDRYEKTHNSQKLYNIHITDVDSGETDFTRKDFRFCEGMYWGDSDADMFSEFTSNLIKITKKSATAGMIGGSREFATNWYVDLEDGCIVYYTIYLDEKYHELMLQR